MTEPRFYIDHGMIHDRVTGKHVTTDGEPPFEDGIEQVLALLNSLCPPGERSHPLSDINDLDEVCRELGIQESAKTPAEAVRELNAEIERLHARVNAQPQWQPISTAPLDGTPILCFRPDSLVQGFTDKTGIDVLWWEHDGQVWCYAGDPIVVDPPTHWMPLPEGPSVTSHDGGRP